jgi:hypothetical protein
MKRTCLPLLVALSVGGIAPAARAAEASPPTPVPAPVVVPPALQALEQKMAQIRLNSISFSRRLDLGVSTNSAGPGIAVASAESSKTIVTTTRGVISLSPLAQSTTTTVAELPANEAPGGVTGKERRIGVTSYFYDPSIARHDGGRPWVRSTRTRQQEELVAELAPLTALLDPMLAGLQRPAMASTGPFAPLLEELGQALSAQETGPATVDGQQTFAFKVTVSPAKLLAKLLSSKQGHRLFKHGPSPNLRYTLEVWLAPSGLPVRVKTVGTPAEGLVSQEDILGVEVPAVVEAPPASKTIDQAQLAKIERRLTKAVDRCVRRHPRRAQACVKRLEP